MDEAAAQTSMSRLTLSSLSFQDCRDLPSPSQRMSTRAQCCVICTSAAPLDPECPVQVAWTNPAAGTMKIRSLITCLLNF